MARARQQAGRPPARREVIEGGSRSTTPRGSRRSWRTRASTSCRCRRAASSRRKAAARRRSCVSVHGPIAKACRRCASCRAVRSAAITARARSAMQCAPPDTTRRSSARARSTFDLAESALQRGDCDFVAARGSRSPIGLVAEDGARSRREVRRCIYTNYCEALDQRHLQVTCQLWIATSRRRIAAARRTLERRQRRLLAPQTEGWLARVRLRASVRRARTTSSRPCRLLRSSPPLRHVDLDLIFRLDRVHLRRLFVARTPSSSRCNVPSARATPLVLVREHELRAPRRTTSCSP